MHLSKKSEVEVYPVGLVDEQKTKTRSMLKSQRFFPETVVMHLAGA